MAANKNSSSPIVYSTHPIERQDEPEAAIVSPADQILQIKLDTKHRGGKVVTVVNGFNGPGLEELGKALKMHCGTGGAVKDGQAIIQGDHREKILEYLVKKGFKKTRK
ncbi:MAG: translation initiation factor [Ferruginibacter sp.]